MQNIVGQNHRRFGVIDDIPDSVLRVIGQNEPVELSHGLQQQLVQKVVELEEYPVHAFKRIASLDLVVAVDIVLARAVGSDRLIVGFVRIGPSPSRIPGYGPE